MLKNYLKVALRDLRRHKGYTLLNVGGLTVALTSALLIFLYVAYELSFDRFHRDADRIYRVVWEEEGNDGAPSVSGATPGTTDRLFEAELPEVEESVLLTTLGYGDMIRMGERFFYTDELITASPNFFDFFSHTFLEGDPAFVLKDPFSIVLTESAVRQYFGPGPALGKQMELTGGWFDRQLFTVSGVIRDVPPNSSFPFSGVFSIKALPVRYRTNWQMTFIRLKKGTDIERLYPRLDELTRKVHATSQEPAIPGIRIGYALEPITSIHLYSTVRHEIAPDRRGNALYVFSFSLIGLLILMLACVNYVNHATARATTRMKEVGIRKVVGSSRTQLIQQHLLESVLLVFVSIVLTIGLVEMLFPTYRTYVGIEAPSFLGYHPYLVPALGILATVVGVLAGAYPAFYLSRYRPAMVLKGTHDSGKGGLGLRRSLIVFQFAISIAMMAGTVLVSRQLEYVRRKDLGFEKSQVLMLLETWRVGDPPVRTVYRDEIKRLARVADVATVNFAPTNDKAPVTYGSYYSDSTLAAGDSHRGSVALNEYWANEGLISTLKLRLAAGRNFDPERASDGEGIIINQAAVNALNLVDPIGKVLYVKAFRFDVDSSDTRKPVDYIAQREIIGVVEDFHYRSLHESIAPMRIEYDSGMPAMLVRLTPGDPQETVREIEAIWNRLRPDMPFEYGFLDQEVDAAYRADKRFRTLVATFSGLAILIACLGIVGLAMFAAERRRKEISIRKVCGASVQQMVALLSKEFLVLVLAAFVLAVPLAYLGVSRWLDNFAYRIEITPAYFVLAGLLALVLALASVSYHALRAALTNPADVLRYE